MEQGAFVVFIAACIIYSIIYSVSISLESVWVCNILKKNNTKNKGMCRMKRSNFIINLLFFIGLWTLLSTQSKNKNLKTLLLFMILFQLILLNISSYLLFSPMLGGYSPLLFGNIERFDKLKPKYVRINKLLYAVFMLAANSAILVTLLSM